LIENYQKQIKLLEEAAQRLYKEWFVDLHFPGHENTKIVDGVPEGWERRTLDSFCSVFTGKKNANQGVLNGIYKFFTCGDTPLLINSYIFDGPAIIISGNGSYTGRTTFYEGKFDLYQRTYACTMRDMENQNLIYGLYEIVKCELTNKISGGTHGAAIPYIVMSDVTKFDFLFNESIMRCFSEKIGRLLSLSSSLSSQIRLLTEARDRLLPKLMSGEIAV
jgi:type I restriction enzyme S subunit